MTASIPQNIVDAFVGAAHGDDTTVNTLLSQYPGIVFLPASWGESALEAAAQMGRLDLVELFLGAGAALDICTAAVSGRRADVEAMLAADPSLVNATGAHGIPLMYYPVIAGDTGLAEFLFRNGATLDGPGGVSTPLHGAIMFQKLDAARWLIEHGARLDLKDHQDRTPRDAALAGGLDDFVELFRSASGERG